MTRLPATFCVEFSRLVFAAVMAASALGAPSLESRLTTPVSSSLSCACGQLSEDGARLQVTPPSLTSTSGINEQYVVGGVESPAGRFPWVAGLLNEMGFNFCGAALIGKRHLLTAAHCLRNKRAEQLKVVVGHADVDIAYLFNNVVNVERLIVHDKFVHADWAHDIALIKVDRDVRDVKPICLPKTSQGARTYSNLVVAGWGKTSTGNQLKPSSLREVNLPQVNQADCEEAWRESGVSFNQLCAGAAGRDTCTYDSGSPLMDIQTKKTRNANSTMNGGAKRRATLVGVTSFGAANCGDAKKPGVYTRVANYLQWIRDKSGNDTTCGCRRL